jgi:hypothetical protein
MLRRIIIAAISLSIIVAFYVLYTMLFSVPAVEQAKQTAEALPPIPKVATMPAVSSDRLQEALMRREGEKLWFDRRDSNQERLLYQFASDHWWWISEHELDLKNPALRVFLKDGKILHVAAQTGRIEVQQVQRKNIEVQRGKLSGEVHIWIDLSNDPERSDPELRSEDIIHVWLDEVDFDLEKGLITSDSEIVVESDVVELLGKNIRITWDQTTNQLKELTIDEGKKLTLPMRAGFFPQAGSSAPADPSAPGLAARWRAMAKSPGAAPIETVSKESNTPAASAPQSQPTTSTAPARGKPRPFILTFERDVHVSQYQRTEAGGSKLASTLAADTLNVLFDMRSMGEQNGDRKSGKERKPKQRKEDADRVEIVWGGQLKMVPETLEEPISTDSAQATQPAPRPTTRQTQTASSTQPTELQVRRFHVVAEGRAVRFEQIGEFDVVCNRMTYKGESKQLELVGLEEPVTIHERSNITIVGTKLFYDHQDGSGTARGEGPGYMQQRSEPEPERAGTPEAISNVAGLINKQTTQSSAREMTIRWEKSFQVDFGTYRRYGHGGDERYIRRAQFQGAAKMTRPSTSEELGAERREGEHLEAEQIVLDVLPPEPGEKDWKIAKKMQRLRANDKVLMSSADQQITCDDLAVDFAPGSEGQVPRVAEAHGRVTVQEEQRRIEADHLLAELRERKITAEANHKLSGSEGSEKSIVKLAANNKPDESKVKIVLSRVDAQGNVHIVDQVQKLDAECDKLRCAFDPESTSQTMEWCELEGPAEGWAVARVGDRFVKGGKITFDAKTEQAKVPGPGELQFVSDQDIDGQQRNEAVPILIGWSDSMTLQGREINHGEFKGQVKVQGKNTTLDCSRLLVDFEAGEQKTEQSPRLKGFVSLSRWFKSKPADQARVELPAKRLIGFQALPDEGKEIKMVYRVEEAGKLVSETEILGRTLVGDLATSRLNIPGSGILLIKDYSVPASQKEKGTNTSMAPLRDPFGTKLKGGGPSVTGFSWQTGLTYFLNTRIAILDGRVLMRHVEGESVLALLKNPSEDPSKKSSPPEDPSKKSSDRRVELDCQSLEVKFLRGAIGSSRSTPGGGELESLRAMGAVYLRDGPQSIIAKEVRYDREDDIILIYGSQTEPARVFYLESVETGRLGRVEGPLIILDRRQEQIRGVKGSTISIDYYEK